MPPVTDFHSVNTVIASICSPNDAATKYSPRTRKAGNARAMGLLTSERSARALFAPFRSLAERAVFAPIPSPRSADPADAAREWRALGGSAETAATATEALELALRAAGRDGSIVVAGSFYLAGELRPLLRQLH